MHVFSLSTRNPEPSTLNPQPSTLNPAPCTLNPAPCTLHPAPSTLNPQPSTLNPQLSILNPQPSTLNPQPSLNPHPEPCMWHHLVEGFGFRDWYFRFPVVGLVFKAAPCKFMWQSSYLLSLKYGCSTFSCWRSFDN